MFHKIRKHIAILLYPAAQEVGFLLDRNAQLSESMLEFREESMKLMRELEEKRKQVDETDIMRELMGTVTLKQTETDENYLIPLTIAEIQAFNRWGADLALSPWWKYLVDWAVNNQAAKTIGSVLKSERNAIFGAGVVDGILLLRDEVDNRKAAHEAFIQKPEQFDPFSIIQ